MPSRNILRLDVADSYYHIYARGIDKRDIFLDEADYAFFISLFKRYLSPEKAKDRSGVVYPNFHANLQLLSFCLMKNHYHLLIYQTDAGTIEKLMRSIMTSYSGYFNRKYKRRGPLFESRYKASHIDAQNYLEHISRYIHLNPRFWQRYPYSSLQYYVGNSQANWLSLAPVMSLFESKEKYLEFLKDYEDHKEMLSQIKHELADT